MNRLITACVVGVTLAAAGLAQAGAFTQWSEARNVETFEGADTALNTTALEGCAAISRSDTELYFASNRPGGVGGLDIWVARRDRPDDPWGAPANLRAPVNSVANDFCPTPARDGRGLLFVSARSGGCGGSDIYRTRRHATHGWAVPVNLGCSVNSAADEASPIAVGATLYFSSTRAGGFASDPPEAVAGDSDLYASPIGEGDTVGAPALVPGVNSASQDARPNVRRDDRELFFDSDRPGGIGGLDLWTAARPDSDAPWETPQNLGPLVNSSADDLRAALSWDGTMLYFGSPRTGGEGSQDIYVTTRARLHG